MVTKKSLRDKTVLLTCGPTWIPIDDVRVLSNISTGELGHTLADMLVKEKANVTLLEGPVRHPFRNKSVQIIPFCYFDELKKLFFKELKKKYDIVIHAAAVSDYQMADPFQTKLSSQFSYLRLYLVPTEKLLDKIKIISPKSFVVGFKLESNMKRDFILFKVRNLFKKAKCDLVVGNCVHKGTYIGYIINSKREVVAQAKSKKGITRNLIRVLKERPKPSK